MNPEENDIAFLFDVDNTLLDSDRVISDLRVHLEQEVGAARAAHYWRLFEELRTELGYADYLGALQRYRGEYPQDPGILIVSRFLLRYPFASRLFPRAVEVIEHVQQWGRAALLTDGDVVFQPHKVDCSGLAAAVHGLIFVSLHKERELAEVERRFPARHYVVMDDKLRLLAAIKKVWGVRVTTVFVAQGHYAVDPEILANFPPADLSIEHIGDLLQYDIAPLAGGTAVHGDRQAFRHPEKL